jgi:sulfite reductase (NADPH) flavoprotein alpha-component
VTAWTPTGPKVELFSAEQWRDIDGLLQQLEPVQALWLSGYLAARAEQAQPAPQVPSSSAIAELTIAYGSETGNCEALARRLYDQVSSVGHSARLVDLAALKVRQLHKLSTLWLITSTHGDGDPPLGAVDFHRELLAAETLDLSGLRFAVLALGDSSYEKFCQTGKEFDERLAVLGAKRLATLVECDVDYADTAQQWFDARIATLPPADPSEVKPTGTSVAAIQTSYSKQRPLDTQVLEQVPLSASTRSHGNFHVTLALDEGSLELEPGDAVGVFARNPPSLVTAVLNATGLSPDTRVSVDEQPLALMDALSSERDLAIPGKKLLQKWAKWSNDQELVALVKDSQLMRGWLRYQHVLNLLCDYPTSVPDAQAFVDALRPLQPRLYDVANYVSVGTDELDLLVKRFDYLLGETAHKGIASHYLCDLQPGDRVRIYPHRNARFTLDRREEAVILIGYGTGLAPYRAYLQARAARGDTNPCWLVMGEQLYEQDFLYQTEWQAWLQSGVLSHLDPVFEDDQPRRDLGDVFAEASSRLIRWLDSGAVIYLCGDKTKLTQCEQKLLQVYGEANGLAHAECASIWKTLTADGRIKRNLY